MTSAGHDRHLLLMAVNDRRQLAARWSTAIDILMSASAIHRHLLYSVQGCLYTGSLSRQTIDGCACNGLMSTKPNKLIGTKLSFQINHASVCRAMMATFVLEDTPVNAAFLSVFSNDIMAEHPLCVVGNFVSWTIQFATNCG